MKTIHFPRWVEVLEASDFSQQTSESFKVTLRWYLAWCHRGKEKVTWEELPVVIN